MWIRTQDREMLMDCNAVGIGLEDDKSIYSNGYVLGTYSSKEKALKVLDNRYILLGIKSYYNAYDTKKKTWKHFAPDFNNRYIFMTDYSGSYSTWETYQNNGKAATAAFF